MLATDFAPNFGWKEPPAYKRNLHALNYAWTDVVPEVVAAVEVITKLPPEFVTWYDQDGKNACVGCGSAKLMALLNVGENVSLQYDWWQHYCWACANDNDPKTTCQRDIGTYSFAGLDALRKMGAYVVGKGWDINLGLDKYFWLTSAPVDGGRTAISLGQYLGTGGPFFQEWITKLVLKNGKYYTPPRAQWKNVAGGHFFGWVDALDSEQMFGFTNTWGTKYPEKVYMPYKDFEYWLSLGAECAVLVDKSFSPPTPPPTPEQRMMKNIKFVDENNITWVSADSVTFTKG